MAKAKDKVELVYTDYKPSVDFPILEFSGQYYKPSILDKKYVDSNTPYLHYHSVLEIGLCHTGEGEVLVENKRLRFAENDMFIICPNTMHISRDTAGTPNSIWEYLYIDVPRLFQDMKIDYPNQNLLMFDSADFPNIISGSRYPELKILFAMIMRELDNREDDYQLFAENLCVSLLLEICRHIPHDEGDSKSVGGAKLIIYPAIEYINRHYAEDISISELADCCNMSLTNFRREFKNIMNESPLEYVNHVRIKKSCELLYDTARSVLDIAYEVGFQTASTFHRNFVSFMHETPLQWRKNVHKHSR